MGSIVQISVDPLICPFMQSGLLPQFCNRGVTSLPKHHEKCCPAKEPRGELGSGLNPGPCLVQCSSLPHLPSPQQNTEANPCGILHLGLDKQQLPDTGVASQGQLTFCPLPYTPLTQKGKCRSNKAQPCT